MNNKIVVETPRYPDRSKMAMLHTTALISQGRFNSFYCNLPDRDRENFEKIGELGERVVLEALSVPGVHQVNIQPYELSLHIGGAFDLREVGNEVAKKLAEFLPGNPIVEQA